MNYLKFYISSFVLCILFMACDDNFLDRTPLDQVTDAVFFRQPNDMKIYLNQFYDRSNFPVDIVREYSDNFIDQASIDTRLRGFLTINGGPAVSYSSIREVNYFLDNYKKCEEDFETYKQYVGEAHFFRALFYFAILKDFGDIQWISTVLETDSPELYGSRDPRNIVADNILADLDTAAMYLPSEKTNGYSRINKWIALLLQSRIALYEGTWEKYHAGTPFGVGNPQPDKYFNKVVEATTSVMNSGLYDIYSTGSPTTDYVDFFGLRDYSNNKEVMFWTKMDIDKGIYVAKWLLRIREPHGLGFTKSFADSYLCIDGMPVATSPLFDGYTTIADEARNRDPRFYQTIFTPDIETPWLISNDGDTTYFDEIYYNKLFSEAIWTCPTGYMRRKDYNPIQAYHHENYEEKPIIQFRYAEVLLNFAEAKAELGNLDQQDINNSIKKLRDRVGMPNLLLNDISNDPNWEFPNLSSVINEIRRERKIELALEGIRVDDILRWAAADELVVGKKPKGARASQFNFSPNFPTDDEGFIDVFHNAMPNGYGFNTARDYLYPIRESAIVLNPAWEQNPGWE